MRRSAAMLFPIVLLSSACAHTGPRGREVQAPRLPDATGAPTSPTPAAGGFRTRLERFWSGEHRDAKDLGAAGKDLEEDIQFPSLHDPPLARYGVPPNRHDPFLFPSLVNLIEQNPRYDDDHPMADFRQRIDRRRQFSIRFPGPDTANFPNSSYTLPKGRAYIETSPFSLTGPSSGLPLSYNWEFLLRYGLTDDLEFRIFSNGPTVISGSDGTTGFAPLAFDMKAHLWGENVRYFVPAAGLEVYLQTPFGSPELSAGTQPSITLLFDKNLPRNWQASFNIGITGNQMPLTVDGVRFDETFYVVSTQWSLQKSLNPDLAVFYQGYVNSANLPRIGNIQREEGDASVVQGLGASYVVNDRVSVFGSYNLGAGQSAPDFFAQGGFAVAF